MTGNYAKTLATALREIRAKHGLTQTQLARKIGISQASLNRMEQANQNVSLKTLEQICRRLKMTPNDILL